MKRWKYFWGSLGLWDRILIGILLAVYIHNLSLGIMEVDAMQYAGISREMSQTGQYLQVHEFGRDYLDKPPLLFWLSSLSMLLFGYHDWSYKLPSVLALLLSGYAVFRFALLYYGRSVAKNAMLIWMTCQAYLLMTNDVRTDGLLTSFVMVSLWLFGEFFEHRDIKKFLLASATMALAMLAKGPIGMVAVLVPIGLHLMVKGRWRDILHPRWLWTLVIVSILLAPMLWGLYQQYDLHPEKEVYGLKGPSGIWFYFWTQSFGRVTGENYWSDGSPWHFFLGSIWWDFFPWVVLLFPALWDGVTRWRNRKEYISFFGFVVIFVALSMSRYKLPHYIYVTLPMASVLVASYIDKLSTRQGILLVRFFILLGAVLLIGIWLWPIHCFPPLTLGFCILWVVGAGGFYLSTQLRSTHYLVSRIVMALLVLPLFFSWQFYPDLLPYQVSSQVGKKLHEPEMQEQEVALLDMDSHAIDFYSPSPVRRNHGDEHIFDQSDTLWVITDPDHLRHIPDIEVLQSYSYAGFHITRISLDRLVAASRPAELHDSMVLARVTHVHD